MNMGIGFSEVILIVLLILLFFGSKELPRFLRDGARFVAKMRRYGDKVKEEFDEVTRELDGPPPLPHDTAVANRKKELRKKYLAARGALDPAERKKKSEAICGLLKNSEQFKRAGAIMLYLSMGAEVETRPLLQAMLAAGKRVVLPYCRKETQSLGIGEIRDLEKDVIIGEKSVPEPRHDLRDHFFRSDLQLIVCPGVAFDSFGARLGRGFAYYDNFLRELKGRVPMVGLGFDMQVQDEQLPFSYSDVVMDQIITESGFRLPEPPGETDLQEEKSPDTAEKPTA
ncbi:MAG: 5-formyltetrahydrofolate cyclo-ligase [Chitinispirillaceae bacterium]|nr:5-formyltetrahydrofolate cyclo-ligase [Chitinispirillaceae bacterium]